MAEDIRALLQNVNEKERLNGLVTIFMGLSNEQQLALLEWSRSICMQIGSYIEKQAMGLSQQDLPAPKMYLELALKVGIIRALSTGNDDLAAGCENASKQVLGEAKAKSLEEFKETVKLSLQLSKW